MIETSQKEIELKENEEESIIQPNLKDEPVNEIPEEKEEIVETSEANDDKPQEVYNEEIKNLNNTASNTKPIKDSLEVGDILLDRD